MNIKELKSDMELKNLYFSEIRFSRKAKIESGDYKIDIKRTYQKLDNDYEIELKVNASKDDFKISVTAVGVFGFTSEIEDENLQESMIKLNGAAIMFPFIRSQVAQVTAQPNMVPLVLPAINVSKLLDENSK